MIGSSTAKYQLGLPFALLPASPALAALHATRARILHPTESAFLDSTHCVKCGSFMSDGGCVVRTKKGRKSLERENNRKVMRKTCRACGFSEHISIGSGNAGMFPRTRHAKPSGTAPKPVHKCSDSEAPAKPEILAIERFSSLPSNASSSSAPAPAPARSKSRVEKKSGLRDMLSRNKEKEAKKREVKGERQGGLAAFLDGL